jgi:hypothetical protein
MVDQVLQKSLFCLDPYDFKPHIVAGKYITPTHLGENSIASMCVEIIICNCAFSENHQYILHALPPLVVETTSLLHVFLLFLALSNIKFQYGVFVLSIYSSPFSRLYCVSHLVT